MNFIHSWSFTSLLIETLQGTVTPLTPTSRTAIQLEGHISVHHTTLGNPQQNTNSATYSSAGCELHTTSRAVKFLWCAESSMAIFPICYSGLDSTGLLHALNFASRCVSSHLRDVPGTQFCLPRSQSWTSERLLPDTVAALMPLTWTLLHPVFQCFVGR